MQCDFPGWHNGPLAWISFPAQGHFAAHKSYCALAQAPRSLQSKLAGGKARHRQPSPEQISQQAATVSRSPAGGGFVTLLQLSTTCIHTHAHTQTHAHACLHTYIDHAHPQTHHMYTYMRTENYAQHTYKHIHMHACMHACTHIETNTQSHIHTHSGCPQGPISFSVVGTALLLEKLMPLLSNLPSCFHKLCPLVAVTEQRPWLECTPVLPPWSQKDTSLWFSTLFGQELERLK